MNFFSSSSSSAKSSAASSKEDKEKELRRIIVSSDGSFKQGYIQKKSKGQSMFGIRNWKTRYITVDINLGLLKFYGTKEDVTKGNKEKG